MVRLHSRAHCGGAIRYACRRRNDWRLLGDDSHLSHFSQRFCRRDDFTLQPANACKDFSESESVGRGRHHCLQDIFTASLLQCPEIPADIGVAPPMPRRSYFDYNSAAQGCSW